MKALKNMITMIAVSTFVLIGCKEEPKKNSNEITKETKKVEQVKPEVEAQSNEATITIKPDSALEYKFKINEGELLTYEWSATGTLRFDFHGDPADTSKFPKGYFKSYSKGSSNGEKGEEKIPFKGSHGWYWKNTSDQEVTVTLITKGEYNIIGVIK